LIFAASPTIGLALFGLVIYTLGGGFAPLTRALITTLVDKEHIARLYAAIAVVEVTTALAAGPSIATLYAAGLKLKGPWLALPYYALTIICFLAGLGVWCFGFLTRKQEEIPYGDEDRDTMVGNTVFLEGDTLRPAL
jgi:MFS family permease